MPVMKEKIEVELEQEPFTYFYDISSGGKQKLEYKIIYVNLPLEKAVKWFKNRFHRDPYNITCSCCGEDYSVYSGNSLDELTQYHREHEYKTMLIRQNPKMTYEEYSKITGAISLEEYFEKEDVLYVEVEEF